MADLGNTSQANTAHKHKSTSWIAVALIIVGVVVLGFAGPLESVPLGIVGGVITLIGVLGAIIWKIMDDAH